MADQLSPPAKIAAGVASTLVISDTQQIRSELIPEEGGDLHGVLYGCGKNTNSCLGLGRLQVGGEKQHITRLDKWPESVFDMSCGANHTAVIEKSKWSQSGILWTAGLGNRGRLGYRNPEDPEDKRVEVEDLWTMDRPRKVTFKNEIRVLRVSCGGDHTLVLDSLNRVWTFGMNTEGQCGVGHKQDVREPHLIKKITDPVHHIAGGGQHSLCIVGGAGDVYSWGCGEHGRLGHGDTAIVTVPKRIEELAIKDCRFVEAGDAHSGVIDSGGVGYVWGAGSYGRLGLGSNSDQHSPRCLDSLRDRQLVQLSFAMFHSLALTRQGRIYVWGSGQALGVQHENNRGVIFSPMLLPSAAITAPVMQVATGPFHSVALLSGGSVVTWGVGSGGRLGHTGGKTHITPKAIFEFFGWSADTLFDPDDGMGQSVASPRAGQTVPLSQVVDAQRLEAFKTAWGAACSEELPDLVIKPGCDASEWGKCVENLDYETAELVVDTIRLPCKLNNEDPKGTLLQVLGVIVAEEVVEELPPWHVVQVGVGACHSAVLTEGGDMYVWGGGENGQLGLGHNRVANVWQPRRVYTQKFFRPVTQIALGYEHTLAITVGGEGWAWGKGEHGQCGTGRAKDAHEPTRIQNIAGIDFIAAGEDHSVAVCRGAVYSWGSAASGKLGLGEDVTAGTQLLPQQVHGITGHATKAACGPNHTCIIGNEGQLWTFGGGWFGRLGLGSNDNKFSANLVQEFAGREDGGWLEAESVSCGAFHTAILTNNKELYLCGRDRCICEPDHILRPKKFLQIGDPGALKIVKIACAESHTLIMVKEGELLSVYAWGNNRQKQLALGRHATAEVFAPELVQAIPGNVETVATGPSHSFALLQSGELFGWGMQTSGRLALENRRHESQFVPLPEKVDMAWSSIEAMTGAVGDMADDDDEDGNKDDKAEQPDDQTGASAVQMGRMLDAIREGQRVQRFRTMQTLLKNEKPQSKESALQKKEEELIKIYQEFTKDIFTELPKREAQFFQLSSDVEQAFQWNLRYIKSPPVDLSNLPTHPAIISKMNLYEELVWVLQQQVITK